MADGGDGQEKTEAPTQKRKDDARRDGKVLSSKESFVFTLLLFGGGLLIGLATFWRGLVGAWGRSFVLPAGTELDPLVFARLAEAGTWLLLLAGAMGAPLMLVILVTQAALGGIGFSTKAFRFKASRLNPMAGLARMVSVRALVELGKAVLKTGLVLAAALLAVLPMLGPLSQSGAMAPGDAVALMGAAIVRVGAAVLVALALVAAADLIWQIISHQKSLRMSLQEIKDETKESEGAPEVKSQLRRRQIEMARRAQEAGALDNIPKATALVTNPTHFAVALRYDPATGAAPEIVAMGRAAMALRVIERAADARVTRIEAPALARALYYTCQIGGTIPVQLYTAVAVLLAHVWRIEQGLAAELPEIDLPDDLRFDAHGRPQARSGDRTG